MNTTKEKLRVYSSKNLKIKPELPRNSPKIPQSQVLPVCLQISVQMYLLEPMQRELSLIFQRHDKLGHLEHFVEYVSTFTFNSLTWFLQTCSNCTYMIFLWQCNDSSRCIGAKRYIYIPIFKYTIYSVPCGIFGKLRGTVKHFLFPRTLFSRKVARPVTRENKVHGNISHASIIVQKMKIAKIKSRE